MFLKRRGYWWLKCPQFITDKIFQLWYMLSRMFDIAAMCLGFNKLESCLKTKNKFGMNKILISYVTKQSMISSSLPNCITRAAARTSKQSRLPNISSANTRSFSFPLIQPETLARDKSRSEPNPVLFITTCTLYGYYVKCEHASRQAHSLAVLSPPPTFRRWHFAAENAPSTGSDRSGEAHGWK